MSPLSLGNCRRIVLLTGAGVSAASGLPTYRGDKGLWKDPAKRNLATAAALASDPDAVWAMFSGFRQAVRAATPNPAHRAIATMESKIPRGGGVTVVTQNVDGLHQRAGSTNVVEIHGSIMRTRCSNGSCSLEPYIDDSPVASVAPRCPICSAHLRVDVVLFDEPLGAEEHLAKRALRDCDLFIAVGTSGTVSPASNFVRSAEYAGARTIYMNLERLTSGADQYHEQLIGAAEELLPQMLARE